MFSKKQSTVELEAQTPSQPVKYASYDLKHNGETVPFALTARVEVDKITVGRRGKVISIALGTEDGHFINLTIKEN